MSRNGKVIVAMSGGVDSSVAACLLKEQGYECVGVFMRVGAHAGEAACDPGPGGGAKSPAQRARSSGAVRASMGTNRPPAAGPRRLKHGCCSASDALDARAVAGRLGLPFYALNFEADFGRIIDYFVDEYAQARTPNPCVMCNIEIKFGKLLRYADMLDAQFVATGHYARVVQRQADAGALPRQAGARQGGPRLARARNRAKDQSYVLFGIRRDDLARCLFPLGEFEDKARVREIAATLGLCVHDKPDSQEICFVPDQDYRRLLRQRRPDAARRGELRDAAGRVLGAHDGVASFTVGQRRGLGVALGRPLYVTRLDVLSNTVTLGDKEDLWSRGLVADGMNWHAAPEELVEGEARASVKIRHMHTPAAARVLLDDAAFHSSPRAGGTRDASPAPRNGPTRPEAAALAKPALPDRVSVLFDEPQLAVTPGQAVVLYDDAEVVLGGGWIRESIATPRADRADRPDGAGGVGVSTR